MTEHKHNPNAKKYYTVRRKRDYVTGLAISFFILIIVFEILLVGWLPFYLRSRRLWEREASREAMKEDFDKLRANLSSIAKRHNGYEAGQINLAYECLNQFAIYLREYETKMTSDQIEETRKALDSFSNLYNKMRIGGINEEHLSINCMAVLKNMSKKYNFQLDPPPPKKDEQPNSKTARNPSHKSEKQEESKR